MTKLAFVGIAVIFGALLQGCATHPVTIKKSDRLFQVSQQQFQHTQSLVEKLNPKPAEQRLFMQAETFYRYRFSPPQENTKRFLAEAAAATTDFPAFQSLAGSFDLQDLRFRAPDSAVQLWETLLEEHPDTVLKPLTLYRLGWAYRSVGVKGLPRSSDEAFDALISEDPESTLATLATEAKQVPWKSKETAEFRSLIPGLGQMYVGESKSGWVRLGIAALALIVVAVPAYDAYQGHHVSNLAAAGGVAGLITLSFDFTSSYDAALHGVVRWNERAEAKFNHEHPQAP